MTNESMIKCQRCGRQLSTQTRGVLADVAQWTVALGPVCAQRVGLARAVPRDASSASPAPPGRVVRDDHTIDWVDALGVST